LENLTLRRVCQRKWMCFDGKEGWFGLMEFPAATREVSRGGETTQGVILNTCIYSLLIAVPSSHPCAMHNPQGEVKGQE
jgi:hypothetical protein